MKDEGIAKLVISAKEMPKAAMKTGGRESKRALKETKI